MQRNCHEFIAYENLVGSRRVRRIAGAQRTGRPVDAAGADRAGGAARAPRAQGADRPRGLAAARPAQEHAAAARLDVLRAHLRRRQLPRLRAEARRRRARHAARGGPQRPRRAGRGRPARADQQDARRAAAGHRRARSAAPRRPPPAPRPTTAGRRADGAPLPVPGAEPRVAEAIREVRRLFQSAQNPPRWPMYIRQAKQFLRNVDASFDERKFGFASLVDLLRALPARRPVPHRARSPGRDAGLPGQRHADAAPRRTCRATRMTRGNVAEPRVADSDDGRTPDGDGRAGMDAVETSPARRKSSRQTSSRR